MDQTVPAPRHPSRRLIAAVALATLVTGAALAGAVYLGRQEPPIVAVASPTASPTPSPSPTPTPTWTPQPLPSESESPSPSASPSSAASDTLLGKDGRLTILLLGSDYRPSHSGNRTDTIMIVSVDPTTGAVAAASIPRDTSGFPTSSSARYGPKINGLYQSLVARLGQTKAAREMKRIIGAGIGVEIDSYAFIGFEGVRQLVNAVGGVDVVLPRAVSDPYYWVTSRNRGVYFAKGRNHLSGDRALIFARTRKGDNDFERARRQQLLVVAAVNAVRERGLKNIPRLIAIAARYAKTDLPLKAAPQLFDIIAKAKVGNATRIVFGPTKWATGGSGSSFSLKLNEVRGWTRQWMGPIAPTTTPAPTAPRHGGTTPR